MSTVDVEQAAQLALDSPDPVVRQFAIRREKAAAELRNLDGVLVLYGEEAEVLKTIAPVPLRNGKLPPAQAVVDDRKTTRLAIAACAIVVESNRPMARPELFDALRKKHDVLCPPTVESLRVRLSESKDRIMLVPTRGYWPVGMDVPADA